MRYCASYPIVCKTISYYHTENHKGSGSNHVFDLSMPSILILVDDVVVQEAVEQQIADADPRTMFDSHKNNWCSPLYHSIPSGIFDCNRG